MAGNILGTLHTFILSLMLPSPFPLMSLNITIVNKETEAHRG